MKIKPGLYLLLLIFGSASCSRKPLMSSGDKPDVRSVQSVISAVNTKGIQSRWVQARAQVSLNGGGFLTSGTASIRSCKDSLIWISVSKLGFEVARGIILADSAFWINSLENTYWKGSTAELNKKYRVPARLGDLQSFIFPAIDPTCEYALENKDQAWWLSQPGQLQRRYEISPLSHLIQSISLSHEGTDLKFRYGDYKATENFWFPYEQTLYIRQNEDLHETRLKFNQVQAAQYLQTPFHIPSGFTPVD
ncbi:MAG TPA: DUF4292 domain-containing protein [Saprospiraceae bacterium]|nr:DUF4292 domain-containing protein [Saprospiraceae bacterium]HNT21046.1 DUF4292 domain-containing protein [Saprospiraceae bacterium]